MRTPSSVHSTVLIKCILQYRSVSIGKYVRQWRRVGSNAEAFRSWNEFSRNPAAFPTPNGSLCTIPSLLGNLRALYSMLQLLFA